MADRRVATGAGAFGSRAFVSSRPDGSAGGLPADGSDEPHMVIEAAVAERPDLAPVIRRYFSSVAQDDMPRTPAAVLGVVVPHVRLAKQRPPGTPVVRVFNQQSGQHADADWFAESTVIDVVNDDMPFLVDTVISSLTAEGVVVHRMVHPRIDVHRDTSGALLDVVASPSARLRGVRHESWMHLLIDRITDAERAERIESALTDALLQVRDVVEDSGDIAETAHDLANAIRRDPPPVPARDIIETADLLDWFAAGHLIFLAGQQFDVPPDDAEAADTAGRQLVPVPETGLGLWRGNTDPAGFTASIPPPGRAEQGSGIALLVTSRASAPSPLAKNLPPFYVAVRLWGEDGEVVGEQRFLGILTAQALNADLAATPVLRRLLDDVLVAVGATADSYDGQRALELLTSYPRAELFSAPATSVVKLARGVLQATGRRELRLFIQVDPYGRFVSALVLLPRDRYTTSVRLAMQNVLVNRVGGRDIRYTARVGDALLAAVHFVITTDPADRPTLDGPAISALTAEVAETIRTWEDQFVSGVLGEEPLDSAGERTRYGAAFDEAYKEDYSSADAVADLHILDALTGPDDLALRVVRSRAEPAPAAAEVAAGRDQPVSVARLKVYVSRADITLSRVLPLLQSLGAVVVDENPYQVTRTDGSAARIYDFGLQFPAGYLPQEDVSADQPGPGEAGVSPQRRGPAPARERLADAFTACWTGRAEVDGFNELVLAAGLTWRQAAIFRAYARYLRQIGTPYTQSYIESVLVGNAGLASRLTDLFALRFDPSFDPLLSGAPTELDGLAPDDKREAGGNAESPEVDASIAAAPAGEIRDHIERRIAAEISAALDDVASLDADRILRGYLLLIQATTRTNAFRSVPDGPRSFLSFKLDPRRVPGIPKPVPVHEIWVYSPELEGVHLRFGDIARGGLRWSDRPEDFRTEILGLVKAQEVKNAVIVPVGAKGGFVVKQPPVPTGDAAADREATLAAGVRCYRMFIQALLDVTDNRSGDRVVGPPQVVRHDPDDPYLVVAADKGTATFSDIANEVAIQNGFWLGDAFASGGSAGYDHKAMGITARGAWESVKHHFRELGIDTQARDFTVVGIGDMSGDVFGNAMLLSRHIRLVAAFDHRHVFVDPDPDAATSWAERQRLFALPRSSWADYDPALISAGGGVWPRSAKSVPVSPEMRAALSLGPATTALSPAELIHAVLLAPVQLIFNGGVGTYVKSSLETHAQVGDKANDQLRVDGRAIRAKVIVEGGNLGVTQLGRIEFARSGGRINTDAIDNSAGVDTSDHEVNIKIALQPHSADGSLPNEERARLLAAMTNEIAALVLADNTAQNRLLGVSRQHAPVMLSVHARLIADLVASGRLNRALEFLPSAADLERRGAAGEGLCSPELAVLVAYVKSGLATEMLASELPELPEFASRLPWYFPTAMRDRYADSLPAHPLARHIVTTMTVNELVNGAGISFAFRLREEMAATPADAIRAFDVTTKVFGLPGLWQEIARKDYRISAAMQNHLVLLSRRLLDRAARWFLVRRPQPLRVGTEIERYQPVVARISPKLPRLLCGDEHEAARADAKRLFREGASAALANRLAYALYAFPLLDIVDVADAEGRDALEVAQLYFALSAHIGLDRTLTAVSALDRGDRWHALARQSVRDNLYHSARAITADVLNATSPEQSPAEKIAQWEAENRFRLERARITLSQIDASGVHDLAALSVAAREIRSMAP